MGNNDGKMTIPWWLRTEAVVVLLLALIAFLVGIGQFKQHASDFEEQAKESFKRIEQHLDTLALKSDVRRNESRIEVLESRERAQSTVLVKLETQIGQLHKDLTDLKELKEILTQILQSQQASSRSNGYEQNGSMP